MMLKDDAMLVGLSVLTRKFADDFGGLMVLLK
jgi:hypothetical protein